MGSQVAMTELPCCSFCDNEAEYDFKTAIGLWAYGCQSCYVAFRFHLELGVGKGQKLIKKEK